MNLSLEHAHTSGETISRLVRYLYLVNIVIEFSKSHFTVPTYFRMMEGMVKPVNSHRVKLGMLGITLMDKEG